MPRTAFIFDIINSSLNCGSFSIFCASKVRLISWKKSFDNAPWKCWKLVGPYHKVLLNSDLIPLLYLISDVRFNVSENSNAVGVGSISLPCGSFFICFCNFFLKVMLVFWKSVCDYSCFFCCSYLEYGFVVSRQTIWYHGILKVDSSGNFP